MSILLTCISSDYLWTRHRRATCGANEAAMRRVNWGVGESGGNVRVCWDVGKYWEVGQKCSRD